MDPVKTKKNRVDSVNNRIKKVIAYSTMSQLGMTNCGIFYFILYNIKCWFHRGGGLLRVYSCSDVVANRCRIKRLQVEESS